jgi:hypothetical protein
VLDTADALGNNYGNYGVEMTKSGSLWEYDYNIDYQGLLVGAWGDDSEVLNDWTCDRPSEHMVDTALSEIHDLSVFDNDIMLTTPLDASFAGGSLVQQHVNWQATDSSDGIAEDTNYFMTLHPDSQLEEEYKSAFAGALYKNASGVRSDHDAIDLGFMYNPGPASQQADITISTTYEQNEEWKVDGSVGLSADILDLKLGASHSISSSTHFSVGYVYHLTIPPGSTSVLWLYTMGTVNFWNASSWGSSGYQGDSRVNDVRGVVWGSSVVTNPGQDLGLPPGGY